MGSVKYPELGIEVVEGTLRSMDEKNGITLEMEDGTQKNFEVVYSERQAEIINRAVAKQMTSEQIDLIANVELSAAQMEQIYNGFRDGLSIYQIAQYATPTWETWQMDLYRYGMDNGLAFSDIKDVVTTCPVWEDSRRIVDHMVKAQRNLIIKDLKDNRFMPEKRLVSKIEKLNGLSGKLNSVKEIRSMCAENAGDQSEIGKLRSEIGKDLRHQETCKFKMQNAPAAAIPAR